MREVVLDTEWSGLDENEDRIVGVCCIEVINRKITGQSFHTFINPGTPLSTFALEVLGLTDAFLSNKPAFAEMARDFLVFLGNDQIISHGAARLETKFINAELSRAGLAALPVDRVFDTVEFLRKRLPGTPAGLHAVSERLGINHHKEKRGPESLMLDCHLAAEVFLKVANEYDLKALS